MNRLTANVMDYVRFHSGQPGRLSLFHWFLVLSFVVIVASSLVSGKLLSDFVRKAMVQRDATVTMDLVSSIIRAENGVAYLVASDPDRQNEGLEKLFAQIAKIPEVIRANLYGRTRVIIWSSAKELTGAVFRTNDELDNAFKGMLAVEEGVIGRTGKAEHAFLENEGNRFIEIYIPVFSNEKNMGQKIVGVVEVYKVPVKLFNAIDWTEKLIWLTSLASGLMLYIALGWIVYRADRIMWRQQQLISEAQTMSAIGEMASAVAHGLRNPLASIRTTAELARGESTKAETDEAFDEIMVQSDRLDNWIKDLLASSTPENFDLELSDLNAILNDQATTFKAQADRQSVRLGFHIADHLPQTEINPIAIRQVISSLISNALEAMPNGGDITIASEVIDDGEKKVRITILDNGHGIPADRMNEVFRPFVTSKGRGLGIGLPLAKRIIERHRGLLHLSRARSGGTCATIDIPIVS